VKSPEVTPDELVALMGMDAAIALVTARGGERLTLPSASKFSKALLRNSDIWAGYQRVGQPGGYSSTSAFYGAMALRHTLSRSQVRRIVENMRIVSKIVA